MKKNPLIALTGNYGSGKTTVLEIFKKLGAITINTDMLVSNILKRPEIINRIRSLLGDKVVKENGELDKKIIAEIIFREPEKRISLEDIIHPEVFNEIKSITTRINEKKIVIIEIPVLFERGYEDRFDKIITVYAGEDDIFKRLKNNGLTDNEIKMRLKAQLPYHEKIKRSDFIIDNSGKKDLEAQAKIIFEKLKSEFLKNNN